MLHFQIKCNLKASKSFVVFSFSSFLTCTFEKKLVYFVFRNKCLKTKQNRFNYATIAKTNVYLTVYILIRFLAFKKNDKLKFHLFF